MLVDVITDSVKGIRVTVNEYKTPEHNALTLQAFNAINEYKLVKSGAASYESLGYGVDGQGAAAFKLFEYIIIDDTIEQAKQEKK